MKISKLQSVNTNYNPLDLVEDIITPQKPYKHPKIN